ncbi:site-specific DNA-methyltransferase [Sphingomonas koreensis]|nr:site-specific DNA-methyltransferase [Sphingomonas koreensis]
MPGVRGQGGDRLREHEQSGHSQSGVNELSSVVGRSHGFETVKPLKLIKKIMQIWCRPGGIVLDPFAGSGTTGHAVLELNQEAGANRRFVLIEQGRPERGDSYARTLTFERLRRAINGERVNKQGVTAVSAEPLPGGFRFSKLTSKVDASAVLSLQREEMLDLLVTSHWDQAERSGAHLSRMPATTSGHLFARNSRGEGYFLVWSGPDQPSVLNRTVFREIAAEAKIEGLTTPFHVYARTSVYPGPNIQFYQIPDRILEKLGFNEATQSYSQREDGRRTPAAHVGETRPPGRRPGHCPQRTTAKVRPSRREAQLQRAPVEQRWQHDVGYRLLRTRRAGPYCLPR